MNREPDGGCPFLVPVVADRLWLCPTSVYCRRPDARLRAPAAATLARTCVRPAHTACPGYREAMRASSGGRRV
ncbi:MAG TPA: hypothetical protein VMQ51_06515 [Candidatus Binatia bacterium]|nr:hypothetical protein [Candidatus Binatia bacterium]